LPRFNRAHHSGLGCVVHHSTIGRLRSEVGQPRSFGDVGSMSGLLESGNGGTIYGARWIACPKSTSKSRMTRSRRQSPGLLRAKSIDARHPDAGQSDGPVFAVAAPLRAGGRHQPQGRSPRAVRSWRSAMSTSAQLPPHAAPCFRLRQPGQEIELSGFGVRG